MERISFSDILDQAGSRLEKAQRIAEKIRNARNYSWVGLYDVKEKEISLIGSAGRSEPAFSTFPRDKGLNGRAVDLGGTVIVNDTDNDEDYLLTFSDTQAEIIVPVFNADGKNIVGTIDAASATKNAFGSGDAAFLETIAADIKTLWNIK